MSAETVFQAKRGLLLSVSLAIVLLSSPLFAQVLPAGTALLPSGTTLEARFSTPTGSGISQEGDRVEATVIAPVRLGGDTLIPQGSTISGRVENVVRLGMGLKHLTASIEYRFDRLRLASGAAIPLNTRLVEVELAKERVDGNGVVHGIHPFADLSSAVSYYAVPVMLLNPALGVPVWGVKNLIAPSANPEIYFPPGTEFILRLTGPADIPPGNADSDDIAPLSRGKLSFVRRLLKASGPLRAYDGSRPSDLVNLLFIGTREQMDRAFHAAGYSGSEGRSPLSLYRMYNSLAKRVGYKKMPMNPLTLNGRPSLFVYQKSLDTIRRRHHVRLWRQSPNANIWLGAAAEDTGFRFERMHWTHATDPRIDEERAKVVNDLAFTGCIAGAELVMPSSRRLVHQWSGADRPIYSDGDIAVVRLNGCGDPRLMAGVAAPLVSRQSSLLSRMLFREWTSMRHDLFRSNLAFTSYNTVKFLAVRADKKNVAEVTSVSSSVRRGFLGNTTQLQDHEASLQ